MYGFNMTTRFRISAERFLKAGFYMKRGTKYTGIYNDTAFLKCIEYDKHSTVWLILLIGLHQFDMI